MNAPMFPRKEDGGRPPEYASAADCLAQALPAIAPRRRMGVAKAAERYRIVRSMGAKVPWRNAVTPYMVEPMDMSASRHYRGAVFAGPARTGKTDGLIINKVAHTITCEPCDTRIIHMDINAARDFSLKKIGNLIQDCPDIRARQSTGRGSDNIFDKRFVGMTLDIGWPVISKMSGSDIPQMLLTDVDRMREDIDGEGDPFDLSMKRTQTFGTLGMTVAESSPGRLVLDEDWKPKPDAPHMAPPTTGILALFNRGTRGRWYWTCRDCGGDFEPDFDLLTYPKKGTPAERGAKAGMFCRCCGVVIAAKHKREFNSLARWLHEANDGRLVEIGDPDIRETDIVSWWLKGAAAAFQSWSELVSKYLTAEDHYSRTGDETALKTTINVDQGLPHRPRSMGVGSDLTVQALKDGAERLPLGIAPADVRFVTVSVDVQKGRFVVQFDAWSRDLERTLIDRVEVHQPPATAPNNEKRAIDPARYKEDWDVLFDLINRVFPVAGTKFGIKPAALIVDSGGEAGVTKNAYAFYRRAKRLGYQRRFFLAKGMSGWNRRRAVEVEPEKEAGQKLKRRTDLRIVQIATWRLKGEIAASLSRKDPGPNAYHLPEGLPENVFEEFCAERQTEKGWEKKVGQARNEALDLAVYGLALAIILKAEKIDWDNAPDWARQIEHNSFAVQIDDAAAPEAEPAPVLAPAPRRRRMRSKGI